MRSHESRSNKSGAGEECWTKTAAGGGSLGLAARATGVEVRGTEVVEAVEAVEVVEKQT